MISSLQKHGHREANNLYTQQTDHRAGRCPTTAPPKHTSLTKKRRPFSLSCRSDYASLHHTARALIHLDFYALYISGKRIQKLCSKRGTAPVEFFVHYFRVLDKTKSDHCALHPEEKRDNVEQEAKPMT